MTRLEALARAEQLSGRETMSDDPMMVDSDTAELIIAELTKQLHVINQLKKDNAGLISEMRAAVEGEKG